jgi:hypothetical protein
MEKFGINENDNRLPEKVIEDILLDINSKKFIIKEFKEKYLNCDFSNANFKNYFKEKKDDVVIKIGDMKQLLEFFQQTVSISIKAIVFLLIKIKMNNSNNLYKSPTLFKYINKDEIKNLNSYSINYNNNKPILTKKDTFKKINLTKNINQSYNQKSNKDDKNKNYNELINNPRRANINNLKKRIIIDESNKNNLEGIISKTGLMLNNSNNLNTNFGNYIKNLKENIPMNNNNSSYMFKTDLTPQMMPKKIKYFEKEKDTNTNLYINNNTKKFDFVKIKNLKYKIKSPLRQTLKEMVKKQKIRAKMYKIPGCNFVKSKAKNRSTISYKEEYKSEALSSFNDEIKFNNYKIFFAEKYGDGNYNNFLRKYRANKINKLMIENELQILSKMINNSNNSIKCMTEKVPCKFNNFLVNNYLKQSENLSTNQITRKKAQKELRYKTPKTQEFYKRMMQDNNQNNSLNILNSKIFSSYRFSTDNQGYKKMFELNDKFNGTKSVNHTFEIN